MSRLNVTNSRDGVKRATVRVDYRLDRDDMIELLAWYFYDLNEDERPEHDRIGERAALDAIKYKLRGDGTSGWPYWFEEREEDEVEASRQWAADVVSRLWGRHFETF